MQGVELERKQYQPYRKGWEHDHCEFCGAEFSLEIPDTLSVGYASVNNYRWICDACFEDFKDLFKWKIR